jgi:uncharacterized protein YkwD
LAALIPVCAVHADLPARIDITQTEECTVARPAAVEMSDALGDVARELSRGGTLAAALDGENYRAANAEVLYLRSRMSDEDVREIIEDRYCTANDRPRFTEFGIYRTTNRAWIVLASPIEPPPLEDAAAVAARVLELVNTAREESRLCGDREVAAAPPLTLSSALTEAAARHAADMAQHGSFGHVGSDGSQSAERVSEAGYSWRSVGENIAAGQSGPDAVVAAWLDSPGHCVNMMDPRFEEMGVAFALAPLKNPDIYWAQDFAAPR